MRLLVRTYAVLLLVVGVLLLGGGGYLLKLHGSPYYMSCGIGVVGSALLLWRFRGEGVTVYGLMWLATLVWALWEAGYDGWALMPRVVFFALVGLALLLPSVRRTLVWRYPAPSSGFVLGAIALGVLVGVALHEFVPPEIPPDPIYQAGVNRLPAQQPASTHDGAVEGDWRHYGNSPGGTRFSALSQITPTNVAQLKLAWSFRIGANVDYQVLQATPLKVDRTLYFCTGTNDVVALDAESGKQIWRFNARADIRYVHLRTCRGVAYYRTPDGFGPCAERIITNTVDARIIAVDAHDGKPCSTFGQNGEVSLLDGMGEVVPGYYYVTSAPTITRGKIVLGGMVWDGQYWGEPSGVVRAFDAVTGKLDWAWDMGHPDRTNLPPPGESYTAATPNSWGPMSADETLGLVYVPTANAGSADYFGGYRRSFDEQYSSSVVALDTATGRPRWSFQTAHHDLWDYDVASQPTLADISTATGVVHALLQPTKRGELFILDRATGAPIYPVEERPAPQTGAVPDDHVSATQPYSVGLPSFRGPDLVEGDMWGISPLDQLWCRIKFREARYEGPLTPPGLSPSIQMPSGAGGMNWGGVAVDINRGVAIVNSNIIPDFVQMLPRAEADKLGLKQFRPGDKMFQYVGLLQQYPQDRTPYAVLANFFLSPLRVPCKRPPYGRLSAVDLRMGKLIWTQAFGTAQDIGPLGIRSRLPLPLGTLNSGGAVVTQGGLFFIGATQDRSLRAYHTVTGQLLWQARLPAHAFATPMTYMSADSGRQFVVIAAGKRVTPGSEVGEYILAYALPKSAGGFN